MDQTILLLEHYKYLLLFPLAIIEGPMIMVIAGFLVTLGFLDAFIVYIIIVLGDIIGDSLAYLLGRFGDRIIHTYGPLIGITPNRVEQAKKYYLSRQTKAVVLSKLIHGIGIAGLVTAGTLKIPYLRYIRSCILVSLPQAFVLLIIGLFFGNAYVQIERYFNAYAATISATVLLTGFIMIVYRFKTKQS